MGTSNGMAPAFGATAYAQMGRLYTPAEPNTYIGLTSFLFASVDPTSVFQAVIYTWNSGFGAIGECL
jgi:hypothetical protein